MPMTALTIRFAFPSLSVSRFTVYDRWGTIIYNRANFVITSGEPIWDGQLNGEAVPRGTYVYRLDCQFPRWHSIKLPRIGGPY